MTINSISFIGLALVLLFCLRIFVMMNSLLWPGSTATFAGQPYLLRRGLHLRSDWLETTPWRRSPTCMGALLLLGAFLGLCVSAARADLSR